jgi:hypothetical protein
MTQRLPPCLDDKINDTTNRIHREKDDALQQNPIYGGMNLTCSLEYRFYQQLNATQTPGLACASIKTHGIPEQLFTLAEAS